LVGVMTNTKAVVAVGLGVCGFAATAAMGMMMLLFVGGWVFRYILPFLLIGVGMMVILVSFLSRPSNPAQLTGEGTI
jgi:hypothetical protein